MTDLADIRSLAVLGLGSSGRAAALLAARRLPGVSITALDAKLEEELGRRRPSCARPASPSTSAQSRACPRASTCW